MWQCRRETKITKWIITLAERVPGINEGKKNDDRNRHQSSVGRSFVNLLESLEISEKAAFNASSSGSSSSALAFVCVDGRYQSEAKGSGELVLNVRRRWYHWPR